jgi:hypothetical protein
MYGVHVQRIDSYLHKSAGERDVLPERMSKTFRPRVTAFSVDVFSVARERPAFPALFKEVDGVDVLFIVGVFADGVLV